MKKFLSFLIIFAFALTIANAQFKVMFVDDDDNGGEGATNFPLALTDWGGVFTSVDIESDGVPTYADMSTYDMVIWYTGRDGLDINLWDLSDTTGVGNNQGYTLIKYNADLIQFADNGGIIWVDSPDGFYDVCPGTPSAFTAGSFVYDKLGISEYSVQSWDDDGNTGVSEANIAAGNTFSTLNTVQWAWSELHLADGFTITDDATSLYEMGPVGYIFEGKPMMLAKNNYITSSMRVARLGDGSTTDQSIINTFVGDIVTAAEAGNFPAASSINEVSSLTLTIYPNPATESVTINLFEINNATEISVYDITGRKILEQNINGQNKITINTSDFASGLYNVILTSGYNTFTTKLSVVK